MGRCAQRYITAASYWSQFDGHASEKKARRTARNETEEGKKRITLRQKIGVTVALYTVACRPAAK
jgi:hypothetical protein